MEKLSQEDIEARLAEFPEWALSGDALQRTIQFEDFLAAMRFVDEVAAIAEAQQHHPDIMIRYNKVTFTVSTHDAGGLTEKDFALARDVDGALVSAGLS